MLSLLLLVVPLARLGCLWARGSLLGCFLNHFRGREALSSDLSGLQESWVPQLVGLFEDAEEVNEMIMWKIRLN